MDTGVQSPNLPRATTSESLLVNAGGGTARQMVDDLAKQLIGSQPMRVATYTATLYETVADLPAVSAQVSPWVYADPDPTKRGIYAVSGAAWVWALPLPYGVIKAVAAEGGTANELHLSTDLPVLDGMTVTIPVTVTNTGNVTVVINEAPALPLRTNSGLEIENGGLPAGGRVVAVREGSELRLTSDVAVASLLLAAKAAAQQDRIDAQDARVIAVAAAAAASTSETNAATALTAVIAAAEAGGDARIFDTKANAMAALGAISDQEVVEVLIDETYDGDRTRYRKESGALVFKRRLDPTGDQIASRSMTPSADTGLPAPQVIRKIFEQNIAVLDKADGDDVKVALQAACTAAGANSRKGRREVIVRGAGSLQMSGPIDIPDHVRLVFDGDARVVPTTDGVTPFRIYGALPTTSYPLTADTAIDDIAIPVGSTNVAAYAVGDFIWITDAKVIDTSPNSNGLVQAQIARVVAKTTDSLILDRPVLYAFTVAQSATVGVMTMRRGLRFENVKVGAQGAARANRGLDLRYCDDIHISDFDWRWNRVQADPSEDYQTVNANGIGLKHCTNVNIERVFGENCAFYLVEIDGACYHVTVRHLEMRLGRHGVSTNWNGPGEPVDILVEDLTTSRTTYGGADTHDVGRDITFRKIRSYGGINDGLQVRTSGVLVEDVVVEGFAKNGVLIYAETEAGHPLLKDIRLRNIRSIRNGRRGVHSVAPIDLEGFSCLQNGATYSLTDSAGVSAPGGRIVNGRIEDSYGPALVYQPYNVNTAVFGPMLVRDVDAPASVRQDVFMYSSATYEGKGLRLRDVRAPGYTTANTFARASSTYIADIDEAGCYWGSGGRKVFTIVLVAGTATITTDAVKTLGITDRYWRSKIRVSRIVAGGTVGSYTVSIADSTSITITSSSNTDTSRLEVEIV